MYSQKKTAAIDKLTFREAEHVYAFEGFMVPGVTSVLGPLGPYGSMPAELLKEAAARGTRVHHNTENWDRGGVGAYLPVDRGYLDAWIKFLSDTNFYVVDIELKVFHAKHRFAGMLDRTGYFPGDPLSIIDIKTGVLQPETALQTAAYMEAYNEGRLGEKAKDRYAVQLKNDGSYVLKRYSDRGDFSVFMAALTIYNWRGKG